MRYIFKRKLLLSLDTACQSIRQQTYSFARLSPTPTEDLETVKQTISSFCFLLPFCWTRLLVFFIGLDLLQQASLTSQSPLSSHFSQAGKQPNVYRNHAFVQQLLNQSLQLIYSSYPLNNYDKKAGEVKRPILH